MFEWLHVVIALVFGLGGAVGGLIGGVWRVAHIEQAIRTDFKKCIDETEKQIEGRLNALVDQFRETFTALREKINLVEMQQVRDFVDKDGFDEFRREYREDMRDLKGKVDGIMKRPRP